MLPPSAFAALPARGSAPAAARVGAVPRPSPPPLWRTAEACQRGVAAGALPRRGAGGGAALATLAALGRRSGRGRRSTTAAVAAAAVAPATVEAPARRKSPPQAAPASSAPSWRERFWFPVASLRELDPKRPTPVRIDGVDLVVWRVPGGEEGKEETGSDEDEAGRWHVFVDACPHRLAPLSEGRVEPKTGCLQCAYHGWEFDGQACCTRIPQVEEEAAKKMRASPRAAATSFPVEVALGCVWAWLGEGPPQGSPLTLAKGTYIEEMVIASTYTRDVPYGYDSLLENFVDVSHIPFAHHGLQGTRDDAKPISMTLPQVSLTADGPDGDLLSFSFEDRTMGKDRQASFQLRSPFLFAYDGGYLGGATGEGSELKEHSKGGRFRLSICCVPVEPGRSRLIILQTRERNEKRNGLLAMLPRWIVHLLSNRFIDSDLAFLHFQERKLRQIPETPADWREGYYMPADSDRSIGAWRQWLSKEGARCVVPGPGCVLPPSPPRSELLDRYQQHTAHCVHCQEGLRTLDSAQLVGGGLGLAALVLDRLGVGPEPLWLALQLLAVAAVVGAHRLRQEFHFVDYEHYKT